MCLFQRCGHTCRLTRLMPGDGLHSPVRPSNILVMPDMFISNRSCRAPSASAGVCGRMFENSTGRFSRLPATDRWISGTVHSSSLRRDRVVARASYLHVNCPVSSDADNEQTIEEFDPGSD